MTTTSENTAVLVTDAVVKTIIQEMQEVGALKEDYRLKISYPKRDGDATDRIVNYLFFDAATDPAYNIYVYKIFDDDYVIKLHGQVSLKRQEELLPFQNIVKSLIETTSGKNPVEDRHIRNNLRTVNYTVIVKFIKDHFLFDEDIFMSDALDEF